MGPRLPGDRGPQFRPEKKKDLTHNPFAALAQKLEGSTPDAAAAEAPPAEPVEPIRAPEPTPPETQAAAPVPQEGGDTGGGQG
jgi:3'-5' exoribonuclease